MSKRYSMVDLGIEALVGRKILSASINDSKDLIVLTIDEGKLFLTWEGECCASCYITHVSGVDALLDATIIAAENAGWEAQSSDKDYHEVYTMGTKLVTSRGYVTFETRLEHNGYYSGKILVSDAGPMDQYYCSRTNWKKGLKPLKDF